MIKKIKRILVPIIAGLSLFFMLVLINQVNQFAVMAENTVKGGAVIAWLVFFAILFFIIYPVLQLLFLPKPLRRPKKRNSELALDNELVEYSRADLKFYSNYKKRLLRNFKSYVKNFDIAVELKEELLAAEEVSEIQEILKRIEEVIDKEANKRIRKFANDVFIFTAISQNSGLDAVLLLKIQIEMIWSIAHLYNQKPHWKEMLEIYLNVFASGLMAIGISDIPIDELVKKISAKSFEQSIFAKIPGVDIASSVTSLLADSLFEGTLNGLLTLRVGYIALDYCKYSEKYDKSRTVKSASKKAVTQIRTLAIEESAIFKKLFFKATLKKTETKLAKQKLRLSRRHKTTEM
ncbi:MAG: YcjF family protein [Candidatus Cloacimonetes bacterium]|nr:YcjF family protein [Candidatus Cloacimonadota bacterium]